MRVGQICGEKYNVVVLASDLEEPQSEYEDE